MTTKEMQQLASEWKLNNEPAMLAFSDYLLERGEVKWAQMVRWFIAAFYHRKASDWWIDRHTGFCDYLNQIEANYDYPDCLPEKWERWAKLLKLEFLDDSARTPQTN